MTIGFVGDIHCQHGRLVRVLDFLRERGVGRIFCTGDFVDGEGDVHACILRAVQNGVEAVLGNHDEWLLQGVACDSAGATQGTELSTPEIGYLAALPTTRTIAAGQGQVLLCHGVGVNLMGKVAPDDEGYALESNEELQRLIRERDYTCMVNGHSHRRMVRNIRGLGIVNVGALVGEEPGFATIDFEAREVQFWDLDGSNAPARGPRAGF